MVDIYEKTGALPDSIDKDLARQLMRNKILEIDRHLEIAAAWATDDPDQRQAHLDRAAELQMSIFGTPEQPHFDSMLHAVRSRAETLAGFGQNDQIKQIANEFLALTGDRPEPADMPSVLLTPAAREIVKKDIAERFFVDDLILPPDSDEPMSHQTARLWFKLVQEATGMQQQGWKTNITDGNAAETSRRDRSVNIGRGRDAFTAATLRLKNKHETRGHGWRSYNGDQLAKKGKPMAGFALPGSLDFEEGIQVLIEQVASAEQNVPGEQYYLATGLMLGMDRNQEPRDFRQTYEVMWRRAAIEAATKGETPNIDKLKLSTYQTMMRVTRGGALDTRDLAYYRGYVKAVTWLNKVAELPYHQRLEQWRYMSSAQFDPTNPLHAAYITR